MRKNIIHDKIQKAFRRATMFGEGTITQNPKSHCHKPFDFYKNATKEELEIMQTITSEELNELGVEDLIWFIRRKANLCREK